MEKETVYVVRYYVKYEGQYFVGVFNDEEVMNEKIDQLKEKHTEGHFHIDEVNMNEGEVSFF